MKQFALILALCLIPLLSFSQVIRLQENFNSSSLPVGWTNSAVTGTQSWSFGIDGSSSNAGNNNLDGTAMAYFDDDNFGSSNTNSTVSLTSPAFDNSNDVSSTLEFDYNFREFAGPSDRFYVEVYDGTAWITVFSTTSNDCGNWLGACVGNFPHANIDISAHKNVNCQVRFTYHDGNDWCWYVGIDNVSVKSTVANDLKVVSIESPQSGCNLSAMETVQVLIKNVGGNNISSPYSLTIDVDNGNQIVTETVNSTINSGDSLLYSLNGTINLSNKTVYSLTAYSSFSLDSVYANDTVTTNVENINALNIPFVENFDSTNSNWIISGQNSSWQIGTPNGTQLSSAFSGAGAAITNLSGNYNPLEQSYLETVCLSSPKPNRTPVLSFQINYISESNFDELILETSIDGGTSWQKVNAGMLSSNWYANGSSWSGFSNGWIRAETSLDSLVGQGDFKLRFIFTSDGSGNREGFAIDDFEIKYQDSTDLVLNQILYPAALSQTCGLGLEHIKVQLKNKGLMNVDSTYLNYRVNNGATITELLDSSIISTQTINYSFLTPYNFSATSTYSVDVWLSTAKDNNWGNDSILNYQVVNTGQSNSSDTLPFYENLDGSNWVPLLNNVNNGVIAPNWTRVSNMSSSYGWNVQTGPTTSTNTGPISDYNGNGNYLYTEASGAINSGDSAVLISPCIYLPLSKEPQLSFYSHGFGRNIPVLLVQVYQAGIWHTIGSITTHPQVSSASPWSRRTFNLSRFKGGTIKLKFKTIYAGGFEGDLAIDNLLLTERYYNDLQMKSVDVMNNTCSPVSTQRVEVSFENGGLSNILPGQYTFSYQLNNDPIVSEVYLDTLKSDSTAVFVFSTPLNSSRPNFNNSLKVYAQSIVDSNKINDTASITFDNLTKRLPFSENFDTISNVPCQNALFTNANTLPNYMSSMNGGWTVHKDSGCNFSMSQGATFQNLTGPSAAASGDQFIYLIGSFLSSRNDVLSLGCFDFTNENNITLEFNYHKYGALGIGNLYIEIEDSSSQTITVDSIIGQTHPLNTSPWTLMSINLSRFAGQVVKVNFRADSPPTPISSRGDMALDDISIYNRLKVSNEEKPTNDKSINLYPNPNNGNFNLNVSNELIGNQYQVFDVKGGIVKQGRIENTNSQIELSRAEKGVYFLRIEGLAKAERIVVL